MEDGSACLPARCLRMKIMTMGMTKVHSTEPKPVAILTILSWSFRSQTSCSQLVYVTLPQQKQQMEVLIICVSLLDFPRCILYYYSSIILYNYLWWPVCRKLGYETILKTKPRSDRWKDHCQSSRGRQNGGGVQNSCGSFRSSWFHTIVSWKSICNWKLIDVLEPPKKGHGLQTF